MKRRKRHSVRRKKKRPNVKVQPAATSKLPPIVSDAIDQAAGQIAATERRRKFIAAISSGKTETPPLVAGALAAAEAADTAHYVLKAEGIDLAAEPRPPIQIVLLQCSVLISALEEALEYDPVKHHNQSAPELILDLNLEQPQARADIRELIGELKRLNAILETSRWPVM
jgi:hypothetical protein